MAGVGHGQRFDLTRENQEAYRKWNRSYRWLLAAILVALLGLALLLALVLLAPASHHPPYTPRLVGYVSVTYAVIIFLCGLLAYGIFWTYRRGPDGVSIGEEGLIFDWNQGRRIVLRWMDSRFRLRVSRVAYPDPRVPNILSVQTAIQSLRYPYIELSEEALDAILVASRAHALEVSELRVLRTGGGYWDRIWIRRAGRVVQPSAHTGSSCAQDTGRPSDHR